MSALWVPKIQPCVATGYRPRPPRLPPLPFRRRKTEAPLCIASQQCAVILMLRVLAVMSAAREGGSVTPRQEAVSGVCTAGAVPAVRGIIEQSFREQSFDRSPIQERPLRGGGGHVRCSTKTLVSFSCTVCGFLPAALLSIRVALETFPQEGPARRLRG